MTKKENQCDGCCYREWHNGDVSRCNFLYNDNRCLINENQKVKK